AQALSRHRPWRAAARARTRGRAYARRGSDARSARVHRASAATAGRHAALKRVRAARSFIRLARREATAKDAVALFVLNAPDAPRPRSRATSRRRVRAAKRIDRRLRATAPA